MTHADHIFLFIGLTGVLVLVLWNRRYKKTIPQRPANLCAYNGCLKPRGYQSLVCEGHRLPCSANKGVYR